MDKDAKAGDADAMERGEAEKTGARAAAEKTRAGAALGLRWVKKAVLGEGRRLDAELEAELADRQQPSKATAAQPGLALDFRL